MYEEQIYTLEQQISDIQNTINNLKEKDIEIFKKQAVKNIGRCFKNEDTYYKIIDIPKEELSIHGVYYNKYKYPCIVVTNLDYSNATPIIDYADIYIDENNNSTDGFREITKDEFCGKFKRCVCTLQCRYIDKL